MVPRTSENQVDSRIMLPPLKLWNRRGVRFSSTSYATAEECVYSFLEGVEKAADWHLELVSANASMAVWDVMSWSPRNTNSASFSISRG